MNMKIGDLIKWEGVKNDLQENLDTDYGIIMSISKESKKVLVQFHDELAWISINSVTTINEQ